MLVFNLGIFFKNLQGGDVAFSATNVLGEMHFVGSVQHLLERTDLDSRLSVTLVSGNLRLQIAFDDDEDRENPEDIEVEARLIREAEGQELELAHTTFRFGDISLKPAGEEPPPDQAG